VGDVRPRPLAPTSPASNLPLLRSRGTYNPADATRRTHVVGPLDAVEDAHVVAAGLRVILAPGVSVAEDVPVGSSVTVTVEELTGLVVATSVQRN
jgi:hypothetical protein